MMDADDSRVQAALLPPPVGTREGPRRPRRRWQAGWVVLAVLATLYGGLGLYVVRALFLA